MSEGLAKPVGEISGQDRSSEDGTRRMVMLPAGGRSQRLVVLILCARWCSTLEDTIETKTELNNPNRRFSLDIA